MLTGLQTVSLSRIMGAVGVCAFLLSFSTPLMAGGMGKMDSQMGEMQGKLDKEAKGKSAEAKDAAAQAGGKATEAKDKAAATQGKATDLQKEASGLTTQPAGKK